MEKEKIRPRDLLVPVAGLIIAICSLIYLILETQTISLVNIALIVIFIMILKKMNKIVVNHS